MGDIAYRLLVDMSARGSLAPSMSALDHQAKGLDTKMKDVGSTLGSGLSSAANSIERIGDRVVGLAATMAKVGVAGGLAGAAFGLKLNNELEQTETSLAAIFNAQGIAKGMTDGLGLASSTIKEMRKDASMLPGEFGDLLSFFKLGATPGFQAGASVDQLEKLSAQGMAAAAATGVQMDQAAREFAQLMQGRSGAHNVFGSMLGFTGDESKKFNAMNGGDRLKAIESALGKYQGAIDTFGGTMDAATSTMKDNAKETLRRATAPLFDKVREQLLIANKWFDNHEFSINRFADKAGVKLAQGFDVARHKLALWWPTLQSFFINAGAEFQKLWEHAKPFLVGMEKLAMSAAGSKGLFSALEAGALAYGGVKAGKMAAPMLGGIMDLVGGGGASGLAGLAIGWEGVAVAAAATLPFLIAGEGAFNALTNASSAFHAEAMRSATALEQNANNSFENTKRAWARVEPVAQYGADFVGTTWLGTFEMMTKGLEIFSGEVDKFAMKLEASAGLAFEKIRMLDTRKELARPEDEFASRHYHPDEDRTKKGAGGGGGGTSIQKVEIVVSSNQDPSRIARLTVDRLLDVSRFPTSSPNARNWSSERPK